VIGRQVTTEPESLWLPLGLMGLALALLFVGLWQRTSLGLLSLGFGSVAVALFLSRAPHLHMGFTATGLEIADPRQTVPFTAIRAVVPRESRGGLTIDVVHERGRLRIPSALSAPPDQVYAFLRRMMPSSAGVCDLPSTLLAYKRDQEQQFGAERVWCCGARDLPPGGSARQRAIGYALLAAGAPWCAVGASGRVGFEWSVLGIAVVALAILVLLGDWSRRRPARDTKAKAGLVLGPLGLALQQEALCGQLTWQQILGVTLRERAARLAVRREDTLPGITLQVAGATIVITDIYDRRLVEIHQQIVRNWQ